MYIKEEKRRLFLLLLVLVLVTLGRLFAVVLEVLESGTNSLRVRVDTGQRGEHLLEELGVIHGLHVVLVLLNRKKKLIKVI